MAKDKKINESVHKGTIPSRADLEQLLRARAHKDLAFRQELLVNPRVVLERDYPDYFPGGKVPDGKVIQVTEEDEQTFHLVLPPKSSDILSDISTQLVEGALEGVRGGIGPVGDLDRIGLSLLRGTRSRSGRAGRGDTGDPDNNLCTGGCNIKG